GVVVDEATGVESGEVVVQPGDAVRELASQVFEEVLEADPGGAGGQAAGGHAFEGSVHVRVAGVEGVDLLGDGAAGRSVRPEGGDGHRGPPRAGQPGQARRAGSVRRRAKAQNRPRVCRAAQAVMTWPSASGGVSAVSTPARGKGSRRMRMVADRVLPNASGGIRRERRVRRTTAKPPSAAIRTATMTR